MFKIGRNEKCPCGSGKKYKVCHLGKEDTLVLDESVDPDRYIKKEMNDNRIKQCVHPNSSECSGSIVQAHSIQNNRILRPIAKDGMLATIQPGVTPKGIIIDIKQKGRKAATTFTGFCGHHDKTTFQPIEDAEYVASDLQNFLFSYRSFAFEYHKKMEAFKNLRKIIGKKSSMLKNQEFLQQLAWHELSANEFEEYKAIYDKGITEENYNVVHTVELEIDRKAKLAVSSMFALEYDLKGNELNDVTSNSPERLKPLTFNIFPNGERTVVLFSWLAEDIPFYSNFEAQLKAIPQHELIRVLNNMIPSYTENFVLSPEVWESFSENQKEELLDLYRDDFTPLRFFNKKNLNVPTGFDLFKELVAAPEGTK